MWLIILTKTVLLYCIHRSCRGPKNIQRTWRLSHWISCLLRSKNKMARTLGRAWYRRKRPWHGLLRSVLHLRWTRNLLIISLCIRRLYKQNTTSRIQAISCIIQRCKLQKQKAKWMFASSQWITYESHTESCESISASCLTYLRGPCAKYSFVGLAKFQSQQIIWEIKKDFSLHLV